MRIENSIILITGGASGIGLFMVKHFLILKATVIFCDLNYDKGKEIEADLSKTYLNKIEFYKCDISIEEEVILMIEDIKNSFGRIDILINNAAIAADGIIATKKSTLKSEIFKKVMNINTYGAFYVSKYVAKLMIDNITNFKQINKLSDQIENDCNGVIIFISSVSATDGMVGQLPYSASKAALNGMILPMARDLGKFKIRVNGISPGVIETPLISTLDGHVKSIIKHSSLGVIGKPENISLGVELLIKNDFINGENIRVDGGVRFPMF